MTIFPRCKKKEEDKPPTPPPPKNNHPNPKLSHLEDRTSAQEGENRKRGSIKKGNGEGNREKIYSLSALNLRM